MFSLYKHKRGQSTLEYAVIIAVVVGALLAIQVYVKRGVQGRLKQAADDIGEQFSPGASTYNYTTIVTSRSNENVIPSNNLSITNTTSALTQNKTGTEYVATYSDVDEYWGNPSNVTNNR